MIILVEIMIFDSFLDQSYHFYFTLIFYHLGEQKFLHQGHCSGTGYVSPSTHQETIDACRIECERRPDVKYFAYKSLSPTDCACYTTECIKDDDYPDHIAYEIIEPGNRISLEPLHRRILGYKYQHVSSFTDRYCSKYFRQLQDRSTCFRYPNRCMLQ